MKEILWQPETERVQRSRMFRFLQAVNREFSKDFTSYAELHHWSIQHIEAFWDFYRRYSGIRFSRHPDKTLSSLSMPGARWFPGAELNYAENLLTAPPRKTAILSKVEGQSHKTLTYGELTVQVKRFASSLLSSGIKPGDRVAGYLPNVPETIIAMLGTAALGAIWTSCSPDFGPQGVKDRFGQVEPRVLVCVEGYTYNGKRYSVIETLKAIIPDIPSLQQIVVVSPDNTSLVTERLPFPTVSTWEQFVSTEDHASFSFSHFPFDHPLFIMYSSGTTGLPKCLVHGAGGTLLQHHKEHALHTDIGSEDVVFYYTTCGWMMWNWLASALAQQATIVLYEGSPGFPDLHVLWDLIDEAGITVFGTSPKFISQNFKQGMNPSKSHDFPSLRAILSTGSPLDKACFNWIYNTVKHDVQLSSICGGTDIISCFMLGNPMLPVRSEEIQCLGLGMDVVALDENNRPVFNQKGELACRAPAPSMPVAFWNDPEDAKYFKAYYDKVPGVWIHGDYIEIRDDGSLIVYGRSDTTLNPGGVRIGTAEIYRIVESMEEVLDSVVIGVEDGHDIRMILFVVLKKETDGLSLCREKIQRRLREEATPRHVPHEIYEIREVPKTLNGKKMESVIRDIFQRKTLVNTSSMANLDCLREFEEIYSNRLLRKGG
ncbi:MAG: acetoacetyl-CoA synthetase [Nitrospirales bacterium]|nr:MAG: acetoacetyl-CoA synthetase [Nitrospirales bacterium]